MSKRFIITLITLIVIGLGAGVAIILAKGYTFSTKTGQLVGTGIITVTSIPDSASVFIDGHLTTATNATISGLAPKKYQVKVVKEGFIPWEKEVEVKEGLVSDLKITLFPAIPTIYPLTYNGVRNPTLSPDSRKLAFVVPISTSSAQTNKKAGVWVWTFESDQPIAFARGAQPHRISTSSGIDYSNASLKWSPDSKQVLATVAKNNYLLDDGGNNFDPRDITAVLDSTLKGWEDDTKAKNAARVEAIKDLGARKVASGAANLKWAPDETKFMFSEVSKESDESKIKFKVFDLETNRQYDIPNANFHFWLPSSRHIVLVEKDQISIVELDGTNKSVIYAGKFDDSYVFAWPDASRLTFVSSFPTPTASEPNLYGVNLK